jgi:membrane protease YdiL (CAAX protease family)
MEIKVHVVVTLFLTSLLLQQRLILALNFQGDHRVSTKQKSLFHLMTLSDRCRFNSTSSLLSADGVHVPNISLHAEHSRRPVSLNVVAGNRWNSKSHTRLLRHLDGLRQVWLDVWYGAMYMQSLVMHLYVLKVFVYFSVMFSLELILKAANLASPWGRTWVLLGLTGIMKCLTVPLKLHRKLCIYCVRGVRVLIARVYPNIGHSQALHWIIFRPIVEELIFRLMSDRLQNVFTDISDAWRNAKSSQGLLRACHATSQSWEDATPVKSVEPTRLWLGRYRTWELLSSSMFGIAQIADNIQSPTSLSDVFALDADEIFSKVNLEFAASQAISCFFFGLKVYIPVYNERGLAAACGSHMLWNGHVFLVFCAIKSHLKSMNLD